MEKWIVHTKKADFAQWAQELNIDPMVARIIRNRDIETIEEARSFLYGTTEDMHDPFLLKDMDKAVDIVMEAVKTGKKIRVIGDYDVDGVTSSYILTRGIKSLGGDVSTAIPHRIHDGYGLNENLVEDAAADGVQFIITCDNGISAVSQIELAGSRGMEVIVTDHHEVPFEILEDGSRKQILPPALAVVNPKRYDDEYPFKSICGAMVTYKLMQAIVAKTGNKSLKSIMDELLQFAAFGTVCDVMELKDENRILVRNGIQKIKTAPNIGLRALMEVNNLQPENISNYHLGFVLGPCVNATGRLDTAITALELMSADDYGSALKAAAELKALNDSRKDLTTEGVEKAEKYIEEHNLAEKSVWLIYLPDVHESIAGIIAGKIREKHNHPVFVLTKTENGIKGSGRSIDAYHMQAHLMEMSALLDKFGGHAMAAGLSLQEENLQELDRRLNENSGLTEEDYVAKIYIDVPMPTGYATLKLAKEIENLEPFGMGNPHPMFAEKDLDILRIIPFGKEKQYSKLKVRNSSGGIVELTSFDHPGVFYDFVDNKYGSGSADSLRDGTSSYKISILYQLSVNRFKEENTQFMLKSYL